MSKEFEQPRSFRPGESANRPYGGNILDAPLPRVISKSATSKGFETQSSLARALGIGQDNVSNWYTGKDVPSPKVFGDLLVLLDLTEEEREPLVEAYANRLANLDNTSRLKISRKNMRPSNNPVGGWIENFCEQEGNSLTGFFKLIGCADVRVSGRGSFSLLTLTDIEVGLQSQYGKETSDSFHRAVDREIRKRQKEGKSVKTSTTRGMRTKQRESKEPLYNGQQVANMLGTTRATVSNHRIKRGWGDKRLLTLSEVEELGKGMKKNRETKGQKTNEVQIYPLAS